jgi:nitrous oxidase accessory protein
VIRALLLSGAVLVQPPDQLPGTVVSSAAELRAALDSGATEISLRAGVYPGDLVIKRPVTLRGARGAILEGSGSGTVLTIDASDVRVDNLHIRHSGRRHTAEDAAIKARGERVAISRVRVEDALFGISLQECKKCVLEQAHVIGGGEGDTELRGDGIKLWESHDSIVRGCTLERSRDLVVWYTKRATLEDNVVKKSRYGSHFMYAHDSIVRRSRVEGNVVGIFVMYSARVTIEENTLAGARGAAGVGIGFKDSDAVVVKNNAIVANTTGTYLDNTPRMKEQPVVFEGNRVALNDVGVRLHIAREGMRFARNDFHENATLLEGDALSADFVENHYSDYEGYDLDGDGIGDVAYEVKALSSQLTDTRPALKLFHGTVAMGVVDAVAQAMPVFSTKKLMIDRRPRMSP